MGRQRDSAVVGIVAYQVSGDHVIVGCTRVVGNQNSACIVLNDVVRDYGMIDTRQVDSFTAIVRVVCREGRGQARATQHPSGSAQTLVVVQHLILCNGDR